MEFSERSWRYGDGFLITFVDPYKGNSSDRFYSYGISREGNKDIILLVNKDGEYFPRVRLDDLKLVIKADQTQNLIIYELGISLDHLYPFKPFIHRNWVINLSYADSDEKKRKILQLHPDPNYDTETSNLRKGVVFEFISRIPTGKTEFQCLLDATHYYNAVSYTHLTLPTKRIV